MKKPHKFFLFIQGIYSIICLLEVSLCLIYQSIDKAAIYADILSFFMLLLILPTASILIVLPTNLIHNIQLVIAKYKEKAPRCIFWLIWTFLSPILYCACFWIAGGLFVAVTGGV